MSVDKDTKYDRQLRLWEATGQQKLEDSSICLINATTTGSELLKNLVLPGIGQFTIVSGARVTEDSLSGNFFLDETDVGEFAASAVTNKLVELNHDVKGVPINDDISDVLDHKSPEFWGSFSAVIVSDFIPIECLDKLQSILWSRKVPLLVINTIGFYGALKLITPETTVVETHDPSRLYDLRIDRPWPELQEYADSINLDDLDDTDHAHIPYIVIFLKALASWKKDHSGLPPQNYPEKKQFRSDYVEKLSRDIKSETNFIEASQSIHRALQVTHVPQHITTLFEHEKVKSNFTQATPYFWIYVRALKNFVQANENLLPLPGNLPDMASDTSNYVKLQSIYREKATRDVEQFTREVIKLFKSIGRSEEDINKASIATFCKNTALLFVAEGSPKFYTSILLDKILQEKSSDLDDDNNDILSIYFAMLNFNLYIDTHKRKPKLGDLDEFLNLFVDRFSPNILVGNIPSRVISTFKEILTHNSTTYHNMSSLLGGVVSQEVLKIVTAQYIPLDNLFVFDGIRSISEKWKV